MQCADGTGRIAADVAFVELDRNDGTKSLIQRAGREDTPIPIVLNLRRMHVNNEPIAYLHTER